jgi:hypothetical protein
MTVVSALRCGEIHTKYSAFCSVLDRDWLQVDDVYRKDAESYLGRVT